MYLTYDEYTEYGGDLDEPQFEDQYYKAAGIVDRYTFNRFREDDEFPKELKRLIYRLIKISTISDSAIGLDVASDSIGSTGTLASESNDGVSISYNNMSAKDLYELIGNIDSDSIDGYVKTYLNGVKNQKGHLVLYRGLYEDE